MSLENLDLSKREYTDILDAVIRSLQSKGFKATRMDDIATGLGMSKRTLYEIFDNKDDMIIKAFTYFKDKQDQKITEFFKTSDNVLEAVLKSILLRQQFINEATPVLYHELNSYAKKFKSIYQNQSNKDIEKGVFTMLQLGVQQGVFRPDKDFKLSLKIFYFQMEALKRCEDMIPENIKPWQIFITVSLNYLRSIVTPKGLDILENYIRTNNLENEEYNKDILNK